MYLILICGVMEGKFFKIKNNYNLCKSVLLKEEEFILYKFQEFKNEESALEYFNLIYMTDVCIIDESFDSWIKKYHNVLIECNSCDIIKNTSNKSINDLLGNLDCSKLTLSKLGIFDENLFDSGKAF